MHTDRDAVGALADDATDRLRHWLMCVREPSLRRRSPAREDSPEGLRVDRPHLRASQSGHSLSQAEIRDLSWTAAIGINVARNALRPALRTPDSRTSPRIRRRPPASDGLPRRRDRVPAPRPRALGGTAWIGPLRPGPRPTGRDEPGPAALKLLAGRRPRLLLGPVEHVDHGLPVGSTELL
jgi:hypothetical protein